MEDLEVEMKRKEGLDGMTTPGNSYRPPECVSLANNPY